MLSYPISESLIGHDKILVMTNETEGHDGDDGMDHVKPWIMGKT